jgi:hypothetical protein
MRLVCLAILPLFPIHASAQSTGAPNSPPRSGKSEVIRLFNGKDLEGWTGHKDKYWSVRDAIIVGKCEDDLPVSTFLVSRRQFVDFSLTVSVRVVRTAQPVGIGFWGEVVPNRGDAFAYKGYLLQVAEPWGLYETFGRGSLSVDPRPARAAWRSNDWNSWELFAQGNRIRVVLNGTLVVDWRDPEPSRIKAGPIALQLRAQELPQEIHYRDLVVMTFPDDSRLQGVKVGDPVPPPESKQPRP